VTLLSPLKRKDCVHVRFQIDEKVNKYDCLNGAFEGDSCFMVVGFFGGFFFRLFLCVKKLVNVHGTVYSMD